MTQALDKEKKLSPWQELNPWPTEHQAGAYIFLFLDIKQLAGGIRHFLNGHETFEKLLKEISLKVGAIRAKLFAINLVIAW